MGAAVTLCVGTDDCVQAGIEGGTIIPSPYLKARCDVVCDQTFSTLFLSAVSVLKDGSFDKQSVLETFFRLTKC